MNTKALASILALVIVLASGCAQQPVRDLESERLQRELSLLQSDPRLAGRSPLEQARAESAIDALIETRDQGERAHRQYLAERRLDIARSAASSEASREHLLELQRERDRMLLQAARQEAELARREAENLRRLSLARAEETERALALAEAADQDRADAARRADLADQEAEQTRRLAQAQAREAELARREADLAAAAADSLRRQLDSLSARQGTQGMVLTLGDVVFSSGQSSLKPEALEHLDRVLDFIAEYPDRRIRIEGHTDSRGSRNLNQVLSQRRADAVRDALVARGVDPARIETLGMGPDLPIDSNDTEAGRARNRRVDIIALDP